MRTTTAIGAVVLACLAGCSGSDAPGDSTGDDAATGTTPTDGTPPTDSGTSPTDTGTPADTGTPPADTGTPDTGPLGTAGNPDGSCKAGIPAGGTPADVSKPTTVVGSGTAASCTFAALKTAVNAGGIVTFNCGAAPVTILVTGTLDLPTTKSTVIDGGTKVPLDGGRTVQILRWDSADFRKNDNRLTLQHINFGQREDHPDQGHPQGPAAVLAGLERR
ncbi:MAG: hypothetical protein IPJ34_33790 [Myxococcales bacterium]|nr:hypothetical protein [Myxococcales bacterium]